MKIEAITNPWLNITSDNIAACDAEYFDSYGPVQEYEEYVNNINTKVELTFSCLPDPFCGNPQSKVYCLNKNPGVPDPCFANCETYKEATLKNLRLEQDTCFWAEHIKNECGKVHAGVNWLKSRTKQIGQILHQQPDIFFIEYFPYHSTKGFDFPEDLPSYQFTNILIEKAMNEGKAILIMREKTKWLKRIKGLEDYPNLYSLKCAQGGYLTPNNIVRKGTHTTITVDEIKKYFKL